jgi:hypothetical protein
VVIRLRRVERDRPLVGGERLVVLVLLEMRVRLGEDLRRIGRHGRLRED